MIAPSSRRAAGPPLKASIVAARQPARNTSAGKVTVASPAPNFSRTSTSPSPFPSLHARADVGEYLAACSDIEHTQLPRTQGRQTSAQSIQTNVPIPQSVRVLPHDGAMRPVSLEVHCHLVARIEGWQARKGEQHCGGDADPLLSVPRDESFAGVVVIEKAECHSGIAARAKVPAMGKSTTN